jgi:hypothetical protein
MPTQRYITRCLLLAKQNVHPFDREIGGHRRNQWHWCCSSSLKRHIISFHKNTHTLQITSHNILLVNK